MLQTDAIRTILAKRVSELETELAALKEEREECTMMKTEEEIPENIRMFLEAVLRGDEIEFPNDIGEGRNTRKGMKALRVLHARFFVLDRGDIVVMPNVKVRGAP